METTKYWGVAGEIGTGQQMCQKWNNIDYGTLYGQNFDQNTEVKGISD